MLQYIKTHPYKICMGLIITAVIFIMIGHIYRDRIQLVLKQELFKFPECSIDYWSISHFLLFGIMGFVLPDKHLSFFSLGLTFELMEDYLSSNETTQLASCQRTKKGFWCNGYQDGYWYMNLTDPWVNITGYILGSAIRTTLVD